MEFHEAKSNIEFWAADIRHQGLAATPPRPEEFLMSVITILDEILPIINKLDEYYMYSTGGED